MTIATSGTVGAYQFDQRKVIEHAFRRAGLAPEMASAENVEIATDLIFTILSEWTAAGFPLWTRQFLLLGTQIGGTDVPCPVGTTDVIHAYWRQFSPYRGAATLSTGASGASLFSGQASSDVTVAGPNPSVTVAFGTPTEVDTVGVLLGGSSSVTAALNVLVSADGVTWTTAQTLASTTYAPGAWVYFDLSPSVTVPYTQIQMPITGSWTVNQLQLGLANSTETEIGPLNIDDYWSLPNKFFQGGRPNSAFTDRQLNNPVLKIWPTPNVNAFYNGTVTALVKRYIQDPGTMSQGLEVPQRGLEALIWRLAVNLIDELPQADSSGTQDAQGGYMALMAKQQKMQRLDERAKRAEALFWSEERSGGPIRIQPNVSCYTR